MFGWQTVRDEATTVVDDRIIITIIAHKECVMVGTALWWPRLMVVFYKTIMSIPAPKLGTS
jgi:hypothetical protein